MADLASAQNDDDRAPILAALSEGKSNGPANSESPRIDARPTQSAEQRLALAEQFMRDCGIWKHFQMFLIDQTAER